MIAHLYNTLTNDRYVVLAIIQAEPLLRNISNNIDLDDVQLARKYVKKQVQVSNKDYHYGTTGTIHGFGYGPIYTSNIITRHTIDTFAKSRSLIFY